MACFKAARLAAREGSASVEALASLLHARRSCRLGAGKAREEAWHKYLEHKRLGRWSLGSYTDSIVVHAERLENSRDEGLRG